MRSCLWGYSERGAVCRGVTYMSKTLSPSCFFIQGQRKAEELNPLVNTVLFEVSYTALFFSNNQQVKLVKS